MSKTLIIIIIYFALGAAGFNSAMASDIFPESYNIVEVNDGGQIFISTNRNSVQPTTFFIKPNWAGEPEAVFIWTGIIKNFSQGYSLGDAVVLAAQPTNNSCLLALQKNDHYEIVNIGSNGQILSKCEVKVISNSSATAFAEFSSTGDNESLSDNTAEFLVNVNGTLFHLQLLNDGMVNVKFVAENVITAAFISEKFKSNGEMPYIFASKNEDHIIVSFSIPDTKTVIVPYSANIVFFSLAHCIVLACEKTPLSTQLYFIDPAAGIRNSVWLETRPELICTNSLKISTEFVYLKYVKGSYSAIRAEVTNSYNINEMQQIAFEKAFIEPYSLSYKGQKYFTVFRNGITTFDESLSQISSDFLAIGDQLSNPLKIQYPGEYLIITNRTNSLILKNNQQRLWFLKRFYYSIGDVILPVILLLIVLLLLQLYRHEKRFLRAILSLPSSGIVFVLDRRGHLIIANPSARRLLGLSINSTLKKPFAFYCLVESVAPIREFVERALSEQISMDKNITVNIDNDEKELFCTITTITNIAGQFRGIVLTGVDITEELSRKQLNNWAQLAHDMQTNLSTIKLNAELLESVTEDENAQRKKKILHQVQLLIHRVRDIVTVGRSDILQKSRVNAEEICHEVRNEFDEAVFPNVKFTIETENFDVLCDKPKIVRALRNAVENSIRSFQGREGIIRISSRRDGTNAVFSVRDNGCGMDERTKKKMLTPYFTTSKRQGGTGIGTMIMQRVIELHGGSMIVNSEKEQGSEILFVLPQIEKKTR